MAEYRSRILYTWAALRTNIDITDTPATVDGEHDLNKAMKSKPAEEEECLQANVGERRTSRRHKCCCATFG